MSALQTGARVGPVINRRQMLGGIAALAGGLVARPLSALAQGNPMSNDPIVTIVFDDMMSIRNLGDYGFPVQSVAPNLTRFRNRNYRFSHALAASPTCHASRTAMFSGVQPTESRVLNSFPSSNYDNSPVALPWIQRELQDAGWHTESWGKIFHGLEPHDNTPAVFNRVVPPYHHARPHGGGVQGLRFGPSRDAQPDQLLADDLSVRLPTLKRGDAIFVGLRFPHVPLSPPQEYFDLFPLHQVQIPEVQPLPGGPLARSILNTPTLTRVRDAGLEREVIRAYLAACRFADVQFQRIVDACPPNTRFVVTSDHGWALGERESIKKGQPWSQCASVPLIVRAPGLYEARGRNRHPVSLTRLPELLRGLTQGYVLPTSALDVAIVAYDAHNGVEARGAYAHDYTLIQHAMGGVMERELYARSDVEQTRNLLDPVASARAGELAGLLS